MTRCFYQEGTSISFACLTRSLDLQGMFVIFAYSSLFSIITSWFFLLTLPEFFQMRIPAQQMVIQPHLPLSFTCGIATIQAVNCERGIPSSPLGRCPVSLGVQSCPFLPGLSWLLSVWVMMWMEFLVFTNSGGNLSCSTNLGKLLKGPCVWVLRCVSWRWLCICQRPWREDTRVFWTGFAESQKQRNTPEKQFVIIFCFCSKTFWSVFSKDSVQLKWHILSVRVCVSLSTWLSKTISNCSLFCGNYLNTCQMEEKSTQCFQVQVHVLFVRYNQ